MLTVVSCMSQCTPNVCLKVLFWLLSSCPNILQVSCQFWQFITILRRFPEQKYHVTRNSRNWLVTTGLGACCYAQSIARVHNAAAYCSNAKHSRDICLSKYVKVCFIWTIITTVTEFLSLVTQNYPIVCIVYMFSFYVLYAVFNTCKVISHQVHIH